ncbi:TonB family protein [bacterium]|nr:TonB family protein [bacterium]
MYRLRRQYERYALYALLLSSALHLLLAFTPASFGAWVFGVKESASRALPSLELIELAPEPAPELVEQPPAPPTIGGNRVIAPPPPVPRLSAQDADSSPLASLALPTESGPPPALDLPLSPNLPGEAEPQFNADSARALDDYLSALYARIERERRYPETCRRLGQQGEVGLSFAIAPDGSLAGEVSLSAPCRYTALNRAAAECVHRSAPFPPLPAFVHEESLGLSLRVRFDLRD